MKKAFWLYIVAINLAVLTGILFCFAYSIPMKTGWAIVLLSLVGLTVIVGFLGKIFEFLDKLRKKAEFPEQPPPDSEPNPFKPNPPPEPSQVPALIKPKPPLKSAHQQPPIELEKN